MQFISLSLFSHLYFPWPPKDHSYFITHPFHIMFVIVITKGHCSYEELKNIYERSGRLRIFRHKTCIPERYGKMQSLYWSRFMCLIYLRLLLLSGSYITFLCCKSIYGSLVIKEQRDSYRALYSLVQLVSQIHLHPGYLINPINTWNNTPILRLSSPLFLHILFSFLAHPSCVLGNSVKLLKIIFCVNFEVFLDFSRYN